MSLKQQLDDLHKYRTPLFLVFIFCMMVSFSFLATRGVDHSSAATNLSGFKPGNIISDAVMGNYNSMTVQQIQTFLTSKNACKNTSYSQYQSLKAQYPHLDWHFENGHFVCLSEEKFGDGEIIGKGQTAAEVIYQAAQDYKINPQVILVLLEKEQSLISDTYPNTRQYRSATGYGCPDTDVCAAKYYGFKNQVRNAAALFRNVLDNGYYAYPEKTKGVYVGYHPNSSCGRSEVYIENRATSALYRYTPYQPNSAALSAGYGMGDSCSAYGNRNFYLYFTDWFGSTQTAIDYDKAVMPDGYYKISSQVSNKFVLDVAGLGKVAGTNVQLWQQYTNGAQLWKVQRDSKTGYYTLVDTNSGLYLVATNSSTSGVNAQLGKAEGSAHQWIIYQTKDNQLVFESVNFPGMVLQLATAQGQNGVNIHLATHANKIEQRWGLYTGQTIANGTYAIYSKLHNNRAIDVAGLSRINGANLQSWEYYGNGFQEWAIAYEAATDSYIITSPYNGLSIEVTGASTRTGANVQLWREYGTCGHRWKIVRTLDNQYTLMSACSVSRVIDIAGGSTQMGANLQIWESNNNNNQKWSFKAIANSGQALKDGVYVLASRADQTRVVDVQGLGKNDGTNIWLWEKYAAGAQKWRVSYNQRTDDYSFVDTNSNKYLAVSNAENKMGNNVILASNRNDCTVRWKLQATKDGFYEIASSCNHNRIIDNTGASTKMGTNIWIWEAYGYNTQQWKLLPN